MADKKMFRLMRDRNNRQSRGTGITGRAEEQAKQRNRQNRGRTRQFVLTERI